MLFYLDETPDQSSGVLFQRNAQYFIWFSFAMQREINPLMFYNSALLDKSFVVLC